MLLLLSLVLATTVDAGAPEADNAELTRIRDEDQADRKPPAGVAIDWKKVGARDAVRLARVKEIYAANALKTGLDFHRAALVLQHSNVPDDFLLAHELCVAALALGDKSAAWLAAATEDRYLMNLSKPQRFGTQYRSEGPDQPMTLYVVEGGVTDSLRARLDVPTLVEAKAAEAKMNAGRAAKDAGR